MGEGVPVLNLGMAGHERLAHRSEPHTEGQTLFYLCSQLPSSAPSQKEQGCQQV